ncbi:Diaminopimelate epimerase [Corynebacterium camporealensis]|uniref:Diaminopimelate epimerase n=1 Tax=Corynebacterium camporealensis TaxID=161896 RepID=A0A0F6QWE5_9CORY|nr:diaminopimelate epimerase [Corynebacterium camporealensis]AKE39352.1 diaminopimelate epimerase [Corynebacterium camporealensis]AVH88525.1 Diaminopimelate epimerase [Corynebacterium camporealensis]MDY5840108.1 diaminopimelate epimerase [Corynebacterium camporealensis]
MKFAKGHGTENDFVIIPDENAELDLNEQRVARLCDRQAGIGGDGLLRVVRAGALVNAGDIDGLPEGVDAQDWFMDYRNADGSIAEMCGNGTRVFAHWVRSRGLVDSDEFVIGTRAGAKQVVVSDCDDNDAHVSVEMGEPEVTGISTVRIAGQSFAGLGVDMGNPHLAAVVPGLDAEALANLDLQQPEFDPEFFPAGVNVEIVTPLDDGKVNMRVYERGVGETRSCGTGTVAAARAALADAEQATGSINVKVPGGTVTVEIFEGGSRLIGPSKIVAEGTTVL